MSSARVNWQLTLQQVKNALITFLDVYVKLRKVDLSLKPDAKPGMFSAAVSSLSGNQTLHRQQSIIKVQNTICAHFKYNEHYDEQAFLNDAAVVCVFLVARAKEAQDTKFITEENMLTSMMSYVTGSQTMSFLTELYHFMKNYLLSKMIKTISKKALHDFYAGKSAQVNLMNKTLREYCMQGQKTEMEQQTAKRDESLLDFLMLTQLKKSSDVTHYYSNETWEMIGAYFYEAHNCSLFEKSKKSLPCIDAVLHFNPIYPYFLQEQYGVYFYNLRVKNEFPNLKSSELNDFYQSAEKGDISISSYLSEHIQKIEIKINDHISSETITEKPKKVKVCVKNATEKLNLSFYKVDAKSDQILPWFVKYNTELFLFYCDKENKKMLPLNPIFFSSINEAYSNGVEIIDLSLDEIKILEVLVKNSGADFGFFERVPNAASSQPVVSQQKTLTQ